MPQRQRNTATIRVSKQTYTNLDSCNPTELPDDVWYGMPLGKRTDYLVSQAVKSTESSDQDPQA